MKRAVFDYLKHASAEVKKKNAFQKFKSKKLKNDLQGASFSVTFLRRRWALFVGACSDSFVCADWTQSGGDGRAKGGFFFSSSCGVVDLWSAVGNAIFHRKVHRQVCGQRSECRRVCLRPRSWGM